MHFPYKNQPNYSIALCSLNFYVLYCNLRGLENCTNKWPIMHMSSDTNWINWEKLVTLDLKCLRVEELKQSFRIVKWQIMQKIRFVNQPNLWWKCFYKVKVKYSKVPHIHIHNDSITNEIEKTLNMKYSNGSLEFSLNNKRVGAGRSKNRANL